MLDFDTILPIIGEFGRYQKILFYLICIPASLPAAVLIFSHLFLSATPEHWCLVPELLSTNLSVDERRSLALPLEPRVGGSDSWSRCSVYQPNWTQVLQKSRTSGQWPPNSNHSWPTAPCDVWEFDTTDYDSTLVTEFNLVCEKKWWPVFCMAAFNVGSLCGNIAWGWVADRWGRRNAFFLLLLIAVFFASASAFVNNYETYTVFRTFVGFTYPAIFQVPFIIVVELTGPSHRTFVGILTCLFVGLAEVVLAGVAYLIRDWFKLALITSLPFTLLFVYWWILPESPRWLLNKNRIHEAEVIIQKAARVNKKEIPSGYLRKLQEQCANQGISGGNDHGSLKDLVRTPNIRRKTFLVIITWTMCSIVYGGLSLMSTSLGVNDYLAFMIVGAVEVPACLLAWGLMDCLGRRWTLCISMLTGGLACVLTHFIAESNQWAIVTLTTIGKLQISLAFAVLYVFAGELFPTVVRARGIGICTFVAGIASVSAPYIVYMAVHNRALPLVIMGLLCVVGGTAAVFLPETLCCHLPETIEEGEEFGKNFNVFDCPVRRKLQPEKYLENGFPTTHRPSLKKVVIDDSSSDSDDSNCI